MGSWALCWEPMQRLCPWIFGDVDVATSPLPSLRELQRAHASLLEEHRRVAGSIATLEASCYDFTKDGESHHRFHPTSRPLPPARELLPLTEFGSTSEHLQHAQARYSLISHHSEWMRLAVRMRQAGAREMVRFIAVSQLHAGAFLNAV